MHVRHKIFLQVLYRRILIFLNVLNFLADRISENIMDMFLFVRNLMSSAVQILSMLLSYLISIASQLILFVSQKTVSTIFFSCNIMSL